MILKKVFNLDISCNLPEKFFIFFEVLQNLSFNVGHVSITYVEFIQQYYGTCDFIGNSLETSWNYIGFFEGGKLLEATAASLKVLAIIR